MRVDTLGSDNSVFKPAYTRMLEIIAEAESRYGTKLYVDTIPGSARSWLNVTVFLHGDRNVVNMVALKMMMWQHRNLRSWERSYLYIYPAAEREKYEKANGYP